MLKNVASITLISVALGFSVTASASVEDELQNICTIVKADDKGELRKKMSSVEKNFSLKLQDYYTGITCGGESLIRTAFLNNAVEAGSLLVKKMPKSQLNAPEQDGKTIRAWVSENNLMSSPIAEVLNSRI
ncbi:DUF3718 domain-containing protein [Alteromonas oceanisediminis]|uniref:DUF3718 domain-containing protein n=1 Tax=Alteromonas oceanisediminis TaxID=2836180 RepID=UPI001BD9163A|nr:DUF3718 domain-containing protein [Alteromonas oceanisediminis]MBT0586275.1 DUF3718 domain-containing protein [Alteromonas oceanisediminis]